MNTLQISTAHLAAAYLLLLLPLSLLLWIRLPLVGQSLKAAARMTVQLVFVGFYLQFIFDLDNLWVTLLWVLVMIGVADLAIARGCDLHLRRIGGAVFVSLLIGTLTPLLFFVLLIFRDGAALSAQYVIPICGMILGNCLSADIIGIRTFYEALNKQQKTYLFYLAQGASIREAVAPFMRQALRAALAPTIASMATIGLVSLPGMMTGVILGGGDPVTAIKYQIAIMIAIFTGTTVTVVLALLLTIRGNFTRFGTLRPDLYLSSQTVEAAVSVR